MLTYSEDANRITRTNIVVPVTTSAAQVTLNQTAVRLEIAARENLSTVTGGTILRALD
jgi:hypothetical protein